MKREPDISRIAAPSWVLPGTILENCRFLEGRVDEVSLLFFDAESSLAYTRQDLPPELARLSLAYHVHLPVDLPWERGGKAAASVCLRLMDKVTFLNASRCVLHPPGADAPFAGAALLEAFAREWKAAGRSPADVHVENIRENDLSALIGSGALGGAELGVCLDLGHMLAYGQDSLARMATGAALEAGTGGFKAGMLHLSAPGTGRKSAHLPLDALDGKDAALGEALCSVLAPGGIVVAEFFAWDYVAVSLPVIREWMAKAPLRAANGEVTA